MAYVCACDTVLHARMLEAIGSHDEDVMIAAMAGPEERLAQQFYFMFALMCEVPVLSKVEHAGDGEGWMALRTRNGGIAGSGAYLGLQLWCGRHHPCD